MLTNYRSFVSKLAEELKKPLPGSGAHILLEPTSRKKYPAVPNLEKAIPGAVLALFYRQNNSIHLIFIQRPQYDGVHSGQIAFPGGRYENTDHNLLFTALRETREEIGIIPEKVKVLGQLSQLYIPPSNFIVSPFVGFLENDPVFVPDNNEVAEVFSIDIESLADKTVLQKLPVKVRGQNFDVPCFFVESRMIWGATAMMLNELLTVIGFFIKTN
jgi:8-oxo-dGTP pyrophosphatase MutT (NUDIX family)